MNILPFIVVKDPSRLAAPCPSFVEEFFEVSKRPKVERYFGLAHSGFTGPLYFL